MKTLRQILFTFSLLIILSISLKAQVGIGTTNPDTTAILDITSIDKGLLIPRLQQNKIDDILQPATGLIVFNATFAKIQYYDGFQWLDLKIEDGTPSRIVNMDGDIAIETELGLADKNVKVIVANQEVMTIDTAKVFIQSGLVLSDDPFQQPKARLEVAGRIKIDDDTTAIPEEGMIRWNEGLNDFEGYTGSKWLSFTQQRTGYGVPAPLRVSETAQFVDPNGEGSDNYGDAIAMDGDYLAIGAPRFGTNFSPLRGQVQIYKREEGNWNLEQVIYGSNSGSAERLGSSLDMQNGRLLIGARNAEIAGVLGKGKAYLYVNNGGVWELEEEFVASDGAANDFFGSAVALHDSTIVVGALLADISGEADRGAAYVFYQQNGQWLFQTKLVDASGVANDQFGASLDIEGEQIVVGNQSLDLGFAQIYRRNGLVWSATERLIPNTASNVIDKFGLSVSLSGQRILIGSPGFDANGVVGSGAVFQFKQGSSITDPWIFDQVIESEAPRIGGGFGQFVKRTNSKYLITETGSAQGYLYASFNGLEYNLTNTFIPNDPQQYDGFGFRAAFSDKGVVIGAPFKDVDGESSQGKVYIYNKN